MESSNVASGSSNPLLDRPRLVGRCDEMCPATEVGHRRLDQLEKPDSAGPRDCPGANLWIKKFERLENNMRSKADREADIRSMVGLRKTMNRLLDLLDMRPLMDIHYFLWDRYRCVSKDLRLQCLDEPTASSPLEVDLEVLGWFEEIARFMMVATYELSGPPREQKAPVPEDDGDLNSIFDAEKVFHAGLNSEQLLKTIVTLLEVYKQMAALNKPCPHAAEFTAYALLLMMSKHDDEGFKSRLRSLRPDVRDSWEVQLALKIYTTAKWQASTSFFKLLKGAPYLICVAAFGYVHPVRERAMKVLNRAAGANLVASPAVPAGPDVAGTSASAGAIAPVEKKRAFKIGVQKMIDALGFDDYDGLKAYRAAYGLLTNVAPDDPNFLLINKEHFNLKRTLDEQATVLMRVKWISSKAEGIPLSTIIRPDGAQPPLAELAQAQAAYQAQIIAQMEQQAAADQAAQADREAAQRQKEEKALAVKQQQEEAERSRLAEEAKRQEEVKEQAQREMQARLDKAAAEATAKAAIEAARVEEERKLREALEMERARKLEEQREAERRRLQAEADKIARALALQEEIRKAKQKVVEERDLLIKKNYQALARTKQMKAERQKDADLLRLRLLVKMAFKNWYKLITAKRSREKHAARCEEAFRRTSIAGPLKPSPLPAAADGADVLVLPKTPKQIVTEQLAWTAKMAESRRRLDLAAVVGPTLADRNPRATVLLWKLGLMSTSGGPTSRSWDSIRCKLSCPTDGGAGGCEVNLASRRDIEISARSAATSVVTCARDLGLEGQPTAQAIAGLSGAVLFVESGLEALYRLRARLQDLLSALPSAVQIPVLILVDKDAIWEQANELCKSIYADRPELFAPVKDICIVSIEQDLQGGLQNVPPEEGLVSGLLWMAQHVPKHPSLEVTPALAFAREELRLTSSGVEAAWPARESPEAWVEAFNQALLRMELRIDEACNSRAGQWQWPPSDAVSGVDRDSQMPYFPVPSAWWAPEAIGTLRAQLRSLMLPDFPTLVYPPSIAAVAARVGAYVVENGMPWELHTDASWVDSLRAAFDHRLRALASNPSVVLLPCQQPSPYTPQGTFFKSIPISAPSNLAVTIRATGTPDWQQPEAQRLDGSGGEMMVLGGGGVRKRKLSEAGSPGLAPQSPLMSEWEETERVLKAGRKMLRETDDVVMDAMTSDVCIPARSRNLSELVNQGLQQIQHWIASM